MSRACSLHNYDYCEMTGGKKCYLIPDRSHHLDNPQDELPKVKRKYKTKALIVILPNVARINYVKFWVFNTYSTPRVKNTSEYEIEHIQLKRGPPLS